MKKDAYVAVLREVRRNWTIPGVSFRVYDLVSDALRISTADGIMMSTWVRLKEMTK